MFIMLVITGRRTSIHLTARGVGIVSRADDFLARFNLQVHGKSLCAIEDGHDISISISLSIRISNLAFFLCLYAYVYFAIVASEDMLA